MSSKFFPLIYTKLTQGLPGRYIGAGRERETEAPGPGEFPPGPGA